MQVEPVSKESPENDCWGLLPSKTSREIFMEKHNHIYNYIIAQFLLKVILVQDAVENYQKIGMQ